jgi:hypothetical protein
MTAKKPKGCKQQLKRQIKRSITIQTSESESSSISYHYSARRRVKTIHRSPTPELQISIAPLLPPINDEELFKIEADDIPETRKDGSLDSQKQAQAELQTQVPISFAPRLQQN